MVALSYFLVCKIQNLFILCIPKLLYLAKIIGMVKAIIKEAVYEVELDEQKIKLDAKPFAMEVAAVSATTYHVLAGSNSYLVELVHIDKEAKLVQLKINNTLYQVALKDEMDALLENLGMDTLLESKAEDLKAPMPGLILEVAVEAGQNVAKGDKLLILEAMKMENVIKAPADGVVGQVHISVGDSVDNGQVLIGFE